jgi:lysophospholipase L1-like esterase
MKTIACLGDSNTVGYDPQSLWGERYPKDVCWTDRLEAAGFRVFNFSANGLGLTPMTVFPVLLREITNIRADLVTVMLGTNDLLMGSSAEETARRMGVLIALILERMEAGKVLLIAPPTLRPGVWVQGEEMIRESEKLREEYRRLAEKTGVRFADAGAWEIPLAYDGVHFTEEGHKVFENKIKESLL